MLDVPQLTAFITERFTRHAFRLETLDAYDVGSDGEDVARYLRGERSPDPARKEPWLSQLRAERAVPNDAAGEDIRILDLAERTRPAGLDIDHDFWLLDDQHVVRMHYDQDAHFTGAEVLEPAALPRYLAARDAGLAAAEPFSSYWRWHPEYHQVNQAA